MTGNPRAVDPRTVDVLAVFCPKCDAMPGELCKQPPDWKPHVQRRMNAYATPGRHLAAVPREDT